jgi:FkbM family methyltransferase
VAADVEQLLLAVKRGARRAGLELRRFNPINSLDAQRAQLLALEQIDLVLDVGANAGQYASGLRQLGYDARIVSFEPLSGAFVDLERRAEGDPSWSCRRLALGDRDGEAVLHIAGNSWSSSLLDMAPAHERAEPRSRYVSEETVPVARLDSLAAEVGLMNPIRALLKLDLQGGELPALRGAENALEHVRLLELELSLVELYHGQALWQEVLDHTGGLGFELIGLSPAFIDPESARLLQMDALLARPQTH